MYTSWCYIDNHPELKVNLVEYHFVYASVCLSFDGLGSLTVAYPGHSYMYFRKLSYLYSIYY